jgi:hypothetical protein
MEPRRRLGGIALGVVISLSLSSSALAGQTPRQDSYYEIWCSNAGTGITYLAKTVDARSIQPEKEPGGKDTATAQYNANNPFGEVCFSVGPLP